MLIAILSLLISFLVTGLAYYLFEQRSKSSEVTRVRQRLGVRTEAKRLAGSDTPALIRSGERNEPRWLSTGGPYLRINDKLQGLIEAAGLTSTPQNIQKQCLLAAVAAAGVVLFA